MTPGEVQTIRKHDGAVSVHVREDAPWKIRISSSQAHQKKADDLLL